MPYIKTKKRRIFMNENTSFSQSFSFSISNLQNILFYHSNILKIVIGHLSRTDIIDALKRRKRSLPGYPIKQLDPVQ